MLFYRRNQYEKQIKTDFVHTVGGADGIQPVRGVPTDGKRGNDYRQ